MRSIKGEMLGFLEPCLKSNIPMVIEHSKRVAIILEIISRPVLDKITTEYELTTSDENLERMRKCMYFAGRYHDIGMTAVPNLILNQEKLFSDAEYEMVKKHVAEGTHLVKKNTSEDSLETKVILDVIYNHHERYNGSGYPSGFSKNQTSLAAQLCAIADSYDSMTTYRTYKDTKTLLQANEDLLKNKGVLYSPNSVDAFMFMFSKIEELYNLRSMYVNENKKIIDKSRGMNLNDI